MPTLFTRCYLPLADTSIRSFIRALVLSFRHSFESSLLPCEIMFSQYGLTFLLLMLAGPGIALPTGGMITAQYVQDSRAFKVNMLICSLFPLVYRETGSK